MSATTRSKSKPAPAKSSKQAPVKGKKRGAPAPPLKRTKSQTGPIPYDNAVDNPDPSSSSSSSNKRRGQTPKRRKGQSPSTPKTPDFDLTVPPQGSPGSSDLDDLDEKALLRATVLSLQQQGRILEQLLAKSSSQSEVVPYATWSTFTRGKVKSFFIRQLLSSDLDMIFNGNREDISKIVVKSVTKEFKFDVGHQPLLNGKAKSVKAYTTAYIHNFYGRCLHPLASVMWDWTGMTRFCFYFVYMLCMYFSWQEAFPCWRN